MVYDMNKKYYSKEKWGVVGNQWKSNLLSISNVALNTYNKLLGGTLYISKLPINVLVPALKLLEEKKSTKRFGYVKNYLILCIKEHKENLEKKKTMRREYVFVPNFTFFLEEKTGNKLIDSNK